jgi:DNA-binding beta-propeller fold protein YncE
VRVDMATGRRGASYAVGSRPVAIAADAKLVCVVSRGEDAVECLDPRSGEVRLRRRVGRGPAAVAMDDDFVWVANADDDTVMRLAR